MKLSLRWLSDYVDLSGIAPEQIADELTMKIALIEGIERQGENIADVRIAHVVKAEPHPNADRLRLCVVDTGSEQLEVVCGAPNVAAGQKIAYAPVGAVLPGDFKLEKRKIRGIVSNGMICSAKELELGEDHSGIMTFDDSAALGQPLIEVLGLNDVLFEIDNKTVTHRADLWGHYGFARELAVIFDRPLKALELDERLTAGADAYSIDIQDAESCPEYLGLLVDNVDGGAQSPPWIAERLLAAEMRPINLLVDLSNFVMLEMSQPTHPFDRDKLDRGIVVRRAQEGETLRTLDEVERKLTRDDLLIADHKQALAIAGVMGGGSSEVSDSTTRLLLESAAFDAVRVRRTSSRLALRTDALARFEKFLDPTAPERAVRRYAHLLRQAQPQVEVHAAFARAGQQVVQSRTVPLRPARARTKLGMELSGQSMAATLEKIGFQVSDPQAETLQVRVPPFRAGRDIGCEDDLIEEVGRLSDYGTIAAQLPRVTCAPPHRDPVKQLENATSLAYIHDCGHSEVLNYSFATDRQIELYHSEDETFVSLIHPVSKEASRLRRSLVPGILEVVAKNQLHQTETRFVEVGRGYVPAAASGEQPDEQHHLVAARWHRKLDGEALLLEARTDLDRVFHRLRRSYAGRAPKETVPAFAHPSRCIEILSNGLVVGYLAQVHPRLAKSFELEADCALTWLDLNLLTKVKETVTTMKALPLFPPALRDLSVTAPRATTIADITKWIRGAGKERVTSVQLFDVYQGKGVPEGYRSLAFRLEYRAPDRTLTDAEVQEIQQRIVSQLERKKFACEVRAGRRGGLLIESSCQDTFMVNSAVAIRRRRKTLPVFRFRQIVASSQGSTILSSR